MPQISRNIPNKSELASKIRQELRVRIRMWESRTRHKFLEWEEAENKTLAYVPDTDVTRARKRDRAAGKPDYVTIQIPYSYAVVMAAHTYLTSVFLGRSPVFQYSGRHGEGMQKTQAMEALIDYQVLNGGMLPYFYTWLYDALKYGYGVIGCYWEERIDEIIMLEERPVLDVLGMPTGGSEKIQTPQMVRVYAGNRMYNVQPQDFIWDVRYPAREFQKGEYTGRRFKLGWNEVVRRQKAGFYINIDDLAKGKTRDYWITNQGSSQLDRPEVFSDQQEDMALGSGIGMKHPQIIGAYELCMEIIPSEWGLGSSDWPSKWVFTISDDLSVLFGIQPLGAMHNSYPYAVIPLEPEGYGLTTRGLPAVLDPVQNTIDWLVNSHFYNVRAALNNKFVVDPSRLVMKDVLNPLPGGIIRLKPEAYGTDARTAMEQMKVNDVTQQHFPNMQMMFGIGERAGGVNDQIMGMLDTGGRKTATEVRTSTSFGINRLKTIAEFASACGVDPLSRMFVGNSQQYYDMDLEFKIAGDLLQQSGPLTLEGAAALAQTQQGGMPPGSNQKPGGFVRVTPETIAGFYDFVPVDGTLPIDRMAQVNLWKDLFQAILAVPAIGMQYDLGGIFQWVAQLAGLKNISQFKIQVTPDQILAAQAQQGNAVPLGNGKPARSKGPKTNPAGGVQSAGMNPPGGLMQ